MGYTTMQHQRTDNHEYYQVALVEKDLPANAGDTRDVSLIPGWSRKWQPLQYSWDSLVAQLVKNPPALAHMFWAHVVFSSCRGILELGQEIQASSCVDPGSLIFHSSCQGELGIGLHSLKGKLDLN